MADRNFGRFGARKGGRLILFILLSVLFHGLVFLIKIDLSTDKSGEESLVSIKYLDDSGAKLPATPVLPPKPEKKKEDPLDGWDGWGDMEASLAAIEKKQRAAAATTPRQRDMPQRSVSQPRSVTPKAAAQRSTTPPPSSSQTQKPKKQQQSLTPTAKSPTNTMDSLDDWNGWGDTESSLAEIERKQQQKQQQNQRNVAMYGGRSQSGKKYESLSSDDYFASQPGGSSYQQQQPQRTFQAYGQSSGQSSYQQGASPAFADALSTGWSKLSSFAKTVAQTTTKAVHDSGLYDAVQGFMNGGTNNRQNSSLLNTQSDSTTPRQQYSSSFQSSTPTSETAPEPVSTQSTTPSYSSQPPPKFVGPSAASQGLKPATGANDEFNELVHGGMSNSRGAKASKPGADGPLCDDLPDVDAWLDSTLAMEAAKQANADASTQATTTTATDSTAVDASKVDETSEAKGDSSELGDDWDTW